MEYEQTISNKLLLNKYNIWPCASHSNNVSNSRQLEIDLHYITNRSEANPLITISKRLRSLKTKTRAKSYLDKVIKQYCSVNNHITNRTINKTS